MTKYCQYHRNHGHTTEECKALQDKIEELVRAGHFRRFIRRDDHSSSSRSRHPPRPDHRRQPNDAHHNSHPTQPNNQQPKPARTDITPADPPLRGTINTISGGFASGGSTSFAKKRHLRHIQSINHITHSHHRRRMPPIVFTDDDFHGLDHQQDDPMVITVEIENYAVKKVLVDQGSLVDILYWATYQELQLPDTAMIPYDEPIYSFSDEQVSTRGYIDLHTVFREGTQTKTILIRFHIVDAPTSYNILLGRPSLNTLGAVVSTPHLAMKFPAPSGDILTIHCDQCLARECYMASLRPQLPIQQTNHIERPPGSCIALSGEDLDPRIGRDVRLEPVEDTTPLELPNGHSINLGTGLNSDERATITPILINNTDLFAWLAADLPGVDPQVASHKLSIYKEARYVSQKKRKLGEERRQAAKVEANKLLSAGFIEEAQYTTWLSNVVLVKKANGKWRMCVDYTDLNKACPRDAYPLPNIDRLVDGAAGNKVLSFLDAYSSYNQIPMAIADMHKTAFITDDANYFYRVMPFGLKNAGATYQRLMDKVFSHLTGHCVEVYVDDMVVKSPSHHQHAEDLEAVFSALRQYNLHLNPDKCIFGVDRGKFLGFMLTQRGIEANPVKCKAIIEMRSPTTVKEVQRLIGRLTAISRFLPKLAEQTQPIIQLLKKSARFTWTDDCEQIFQKLKTT